MKFWGLEINSMPKQVGVIAVSADCPERGQPMGGIVTDMMHSICGSGVRASRAPSGLSGPSNVEVAAPDLLAIGGSVARIEADPLRSLHGFI